MEGLESCGGREAAGFAHLQAIKAESDNLLTVNPPPPRWWVEKMADVLRDERAGICFRDRYGFCSTGSQISWLPAKPDQAVMVAASHFFTGASDPLCGTPYKLFAFTDPITKEETQDHHTKRLWDMWRKRAINRETINTSLSDALTKIEDEGLSSLENEDTRKQSTFAEIMQREIKLLETSSG